jgi:predicted RNA-binding protein YlqC (UPF0109 family)
MNNLSHVEDLLIDFVAALVSNKEAVVIGRTESSSTLIFTIDVAADDRGKIIGKNGVVINALKTLFFVLGAKHKKKIELELRE